MRLNLGKGFFGKSGLAALLGATVFAAGCHEIKGGGWIDGALGGKATFGLQAKCRVTDPYGSGEELPWVYEGQFQYHDKTAGVSFHGDLVFYAAGFSPDDNSCAGTNPGVAGLINGTCVSRPGGNAGTMVLWVEDNGTPGELADDLLGVYATCTDSGIPYSTSAGYDEPLPGLILPIGVPLRGGNIVTVGHRD